MEIEKLTFDDTEILRSLDKIEAALSGIAEDGKVAGDALNDAMTTALRTLWKYTDGIQANGEATGQQAQKIKEAMASVRAWQKEIEKAEKGQNSTIRTLAEWKAQLEKWRQSAQNANTELDKTAKKTGIIASVFNGAKNAISSFFNIFKRGNQDVAQSGNAAQTAGKGFNLLNQILKASPVLYIIDLFAKFLGMLMQSQGVIDTVNKYWAAFNGALSVVQERITGLVEAAKKLFSGDFSGAFESAKQAVSGLGAEMDKAARKAYDLEARYQALQKAQLSAAVGIAKQRIELERLKEIGEDETLSAEQRLNALKKAESIESELYKKRISQASEYLGYLRERNSIGEQSDAKQKELNEAEIELLELLSEAEKSHASIQKEMREITKKANDDLKKELLAINDLLKENRLLLASDAEARALAEVNAKFDEQVRKTQAAIGVFDALNKAKGLTPEQVAQQKELAGQLQTLEEKRLSALVDTLAEFAEKEAEIDNSKRRKQQEQTREAALKEVADAQKLGELRVSLLEADKERYLATLRAAGRDESELQAEQIEFDKLVQKARLENQLQFLEKSLALTDAADMAAIEQLKTQIATIKTQIETLNIPDGDKPKTIWDILGITDEDQQEGVKKAVAEIEQSLKSLTQTRIAAAEAAVQAAEKEVDARQDALDKEKELQEKGFANNVALREKELEAAKVQRDKALKEEAKARRAAILLDSVGQVSNLITASTNIFKSLSGIPFVGIPLAVATIGLMFGAFVKAKSQALKAAEAPKLRKGRKITGRTHEQGGEHITDTAGNVYEVENGEWIIGTAHSREHDDFLSDLNSGEFRNVDLSRMAREHARHYRNPVSAMLPGIEFAQSQRQEAEHAMQFGIMKAAYMEGSNRIVQAINEKPVIMPTKTGYRRETVKDGAKVLETVSFE